MSEGILEDADLLIDAISTCINDRYTCDECPYKEKTRIEIPIFGITRNVNKLQYRKECVELLLFDAKAYIIEHKKEE